MRSRTTKLIIAATETIREQSAIIERLEVEKRDTELAYMRISRDLIEQFLIALDKPEEHDVFRERLTVGLGFYRDEIAVREEQVG